MSFTVAGGSLVGASVGAGVGALFLIYYLIRHWGRPGAAWFIGNLSSVAVFCFSYGLSLLVFDPTVRLVFEMVTFIALCFMGPFFLAFGLGYTGRSDLLAHPFSALIWAVPLVTAGLAVTNPVHGLVWQGFEIDSVFSVATVAYTIQPWGVFAILFCLGTAAVGSLLLIGTIVSYGPLYRREATAVILSTVPPTVGVLVWLTGIGPVPQLHLTAPLMLIHISLDTFAFVGTHMFQTNPTTQRAAQQSALDDLNEPLLVVDSDDRVVNMNKRAKTLFQISDRLPVALEAVIGQSLSALREAGDIKLDGTYAVSYTPLSDPRGGSVGGLVVLYDVTDERRRKQQLGVLNRVLRHNLRNEISVIRGYADLIEARSNAPEIDAQATSITDASDRLLSIAEKVRGFEQLQDRELHLTNIDVEQFLSEIKGQFDTPVAAIDWQVSSSDLTVRTDAQLLSLVLSNLIENAIRHADTDEPTVTVAVSAAEEGTIFEVRDSNQQIPQIEIESLRAGDETPLQHGQGVGLWIVNWCVSLLDGEIEFQYDDGNRVRVTLPDRS